MFILFATVADIADQPRSRRNGNGKHWSISSAAHTASPTSIESSITVGGYEGE